MTTELVVGLVTVFLALVGGAAGWFGRQQYGAEHEKRKQAERDANAANERADRATDAPASKQEARRILRDRLKRLSRRMRD